MIAAVEQFATNEFDSDLVIISANVKAPES
jgi:hypothetical protein